MERNSAGGAPGKPRELDAPELKKLEELIRRSFRVRGEPRLREAPVYDLRRGEAAIRGEVREAEDALKLAAAVPAEPADAPELHLFDDPKPLTA